VGASSVHPAFAAINVCLTTRSCRCDDGPFDTCGGGNPIRRRRAYAGHTAKQMPMPRPMGLSNETKHVVCNAWQS